MKKIKLYIAASLDQRIAEPDGGIEFLSNYPVNEEMNYGYNDLLASVDTVIMGGRTYREILCMDVLWPYKGMDTYVVSHHTWEDENDVCFIHHQKNGLHRRSRELKSFSRNILNWNRHMDYVIHLG